MLGAYFVDLIILLMAAVICVPIAQVLRLGTVPGFLLAGIAVGPSGLSLINKAIEIGHFSEIGVVLLLFVIGIELKPAQLRRMKRLVFGLGSVQLVACGLGLSAISFFFFKNSGHASVLIGPALALSSTAFVVQIIAEKKLLLSRFGRASIGILLLQDLAVVPLLALVPLLAMPEMSLSADIGLAFVKSILILCVVIFAGRYFLNPLLHRVALAGSSDIFTASAVLIVLGAAYATERAGLSMAMGAFVAGMLISDSYYRHQILAEIQPFRGLLLGLFFMSMGMSFNLSLLLEDPVSSMVFVILLIAVKIVVLFPITIIFGLGRKNGLAVSLILAQSGEFALVLFSLAFQASIIDKILFQQLLLVVLMSMLITPLLSHWAHMILDRDSVKDSQQHTKDLHNPIVIAGFGRVGQHIGDILTRLEKPFVALDLDAELVAQKRAKGYPVFYGDVRNLEMLKAAGVTNSDMIIVAIKCPDVAEDVASDLVKVYPHKQLYARCQNVQQSLNLRNLGAKIVSENIESGVQLARLALKDLGLDKKQYSKILKQYHNEYYQQIDAAIEQDSKDNV